MVSKLKVGDVVVGWESWEGREWVFGGARCSVVVRLALTPYMGDAAIRANLGISRGQKGGLMSCRVGLHRLLSISGGICPNIPHLSPSSTIFWPLHVLVAMAAAGHGDDRTGILAPPNGLHMAQHRSNGIWAQGR